MIKAAIIGGTGYGGSELLRILVQHPEVDITAITSRSQVGKPVSDVHPNLFHYKNLFFIEEDLDAIAEEADVIFFALPHVESMKRIPQVMGKAKIIDLSGDYRLKSVETYETYYKETHTSPELLAQAVYGLTELNREAIKTADLVACPGCFPTGASLAVLPIVGADFVQGTFIFDSKTGSSGSGASASSGTHHPERVNDFRAYKIFTHRHQPEIQQTLEMTSGRAVDVTFTPHSAPMVRGIFTTAYVPLTEPVDIETVKGCFEAAYNDEPFVRLVSNPRSLVVAGTNFCDIAFATSGKMLIVTSVIDNLVKGASGQAVQNMNLMFGLDETTALTFPGTYP